MAVVNRNGALYMGKVLGGLPQDLASNAYSGGRIQSSLERVTIVVTDEATSTYSVGRLPKDAVLLPTTAIRVAAAVTGTIDMGDANDPDGLIDGYAGTANTTVPLGTPAATSWVPTVADIGKPLWELLGYATRDAAPADIDIYITLVGSTQASADAVIWVNFQFTLPG